MYKQKQRDRIARREVIIGSIAGALFIAAMLGFMAWHTYRVDQWLGGVFSV